MKRALFILAALTFGRTLASAPIASVAVRGNENLPAEEIIAISHLQAGLPFDANTATQAQQYLKAWGVFESALVISKQMPQGIAVILQVKEAPLIADIQVSGNYPLIANKILRPLSIRPGDAYLERTARLEAEKIREVYTRAGFYEAKVSFHTAPAKEKNSLILHYTIERGPRLRIRNVSVTGTSRWPKGRFVSLLNPLRPFSEKRLKHSLQAIETLYHEHGFLRAQAKITKRTVHPKKGWVDLELEVEEGPQVEVWFTGRKAFSVPTLKEAITIYKTGSFDDFELEASRESLAEFFRKMAYPEAVITVGKKQIDTQTWRVIFDIQSGPKETIKQVRFFGNHSISGSKLKKILINRPHSLGSRGVLLEEYFEQDKKAIIDLYRSEGFLNVAVTGMEAHKTPSGFSWQIDIHIEEQANIKISAIVLEGNQRFDRKTLLKNTSLREGDSFSPLTFAQDREQLLLFYKDHGFPYAVITPSVKTSDTALITLHYLFQENGPAHIGQIVMVGDILTGVRAIRRAMTIKEGDPYSYQKILESELALRRMTAFRSVKIETIGLEQQQSTVDLVVRIEERQPLQIDLDAQYSTDNLYSGEIIFSNYNSFGWAKQTHLRLKGGLENSRGEANWIDPRFLGSDFQFTLGGWMDYTKKPAQSPLQPGTSFGFFRQFHRMGLLTRYELTRTYVVDGDLLSNNQRDSTLSKVIGSVSFDTRDNFGDPHRGIFALAGANLVDEIRGSQANFIKFRTGFSHYWTLWRPVTFTQGLRFDRIESIGDNVNVPTSELIFLGGDDTLRGFREDRVGPLDANASPLGGRTRWIYNAELHFRLARSLQMAWFFDAGSLTNAFSEINSDTIRESAGVGFRYITPVGPIRADYGFVLDTQTGEPSGRFHLTFGYPF